MKIGIIGHGFVGKAISQTFSTKHEIKIHDTNPEESTHSLQETLESELTFICVPTPTNFETKQFDSSILDSVIDQCAPIAIQTGTILIVKSTCIPGTMERYAQKYPELKLVYNPEFLTERSYLEDFKNQKRVILGASSVEEFRPVWNFYQKEFPKIEIKWMTLTEAQMVKYVTNAFFAAKVSFFNEIHDVCEAHGVDYEIIRRSVILDDRIHESHTMVPGPDGDRGFGGKCLPKDLLALAGSSKNVGHDPELLWSIWKKNEQVRDKLDWLDIPGASTNS